VAPVVSVIDLAEMRVVKSEPTGGGRPVDIVLTPDGSANAGTFTYITPGVLSTPPSSTGHHWR